CTLAGDKHVVRREHWDIVKDGCIVCYSGHFDNVLDLVSLGELCGAPREVRPLVHEYVLPGDRRVFVLAEGRLVNLGCAEGHPAAVMDMSFANQAGAAEYMTANASSLAPGVYDVPRAIDEEIARLKLAAMGVHIDTLTAEQDAYLHAWQHGT
ncbi:MAG: adenosylhomocysteinase, partial [Armatimonadetes bacterium]|nr:adenosylhomocysteinase [Armatimonadota bacterium]